MKVTIRDVAQMAGVSVSTVSRVMNNPELVNGETKDKVTTAMNLLHFHPSAIARGLSYQSTKSIGFIIPRVTDFWFSELYRGIDTAAVQHGMRVLLYDTERSVGRTVDGFNFLKEQRVDGLIFSSGYIVDEFQMALARLDLPVALVLTESHKSSIPAFKVDDMKASFDAVAYLVARGHQSIAMIAGPVDDLIAGLPRIQGYRTALQHFQLPFQDDLLCHGDFRFEHGYAAMHELLERQTRTPFSAVFAASDEMALGAMRCLQEHGLRVPDDISIIGYDNLKIAHMVTPSLTTVSQPFEDIGHAAVNCLVDMIQGRHQPKDGATTFLPHRIVERESVAPRKFFD